MAGDSQMTSPVSGSSASAMASGLAQVIRVPSSPVASRWSVPPYSGRTATMCGVPACTQEIRAAEIAAMPLPKATACGVPSSAARASSKRATVGFHSLA